MSGIAGILRLNGAPVAPGEIAAMTSAIAHRGRDGIQHWIGEGIALGHCMMRTTQRALNDVQPLRDETGELALVLDGTVDNDEELSSRLRSKGVRLRSLTDAELVLRAYETWGEDCPLHIDGDFAFAVWDARRRELLCVRDRLGGKPFYYVDFPHFFSFASDEEAWLDHPDVPTVPNEDRIACILLPEFDGYDFDASWLQNIRKLPPAMVMRRGPARPLSITKYWQFENQPELRFSSDADCAAQFRDTFTDAVRRKMRCIGSPSLMLSGGMDSASIAGCMRHVADFSGNPLHTYSIISDDRADSETQNILSINRDHAAQSHMSGVPSFSGGLSEDDLLHVVLDNPHPVNDSITLAGMIYRWAAREGHRIMADGLDGDLATNVPFRYMAYLMRAGNLGGAWRECREATLNNTYQRGESAFKLAALSAWDTIATPQMRQLRHRLQDRNHSAKLLEAGTAHPDFVARCRLAEKMREFHEPKSFEFVDPQTWQIKSLVPIGLARGLEGFDRVANLHGIEPRHPWTDLKLLQFYTRLPIEQKVRHGWTKYLVRSATAPWLDERVRWNTDKSHLGWHLLARIVQGHKEKLLSVFGPDARTRAYADWSKYAPMLERAANGSTIIDRDVAPLFELFSLENWLRRIA